MKSASAVALSLLLVGSVAGPAWPAGSSSSSPGTLDSSNPSARSPSEGNSSSTLESSQPEAESGAGSPSAKTGVQHETMQKLIEAMRDLAQTVKEQTKEPSAQAKLDQVLTNLDTLRIQHQSSGPFNNMAPGSRGSRAPGAGSSSGAPPAPGSGM